MLWFKQQLETMSSIFSQSKVLMSLPVQSPAPPWFMHKFGENYLSEKEKWQEVFTEALGEMQNRHAKKLKRIEDEYPILKDGELRNTWYRYPPPTPTLPRPTLLSPPTPPAEPLGPKAPQRSQGGGGGG